MNMATTIPNVIRALGNIHPDGFTKNEFIEAFLMAGYGSEKTLRRWKQCVLGNQIVPNPENETLYISRYSPAHMTYYQEYLESQPLRAVHIERDGSAVFLA